YYPDHPELRVLGCDPDADVYGKGVEDCKPEQDAEETTWRTSGGHLHFSPANVGEPGVAEHVVYFCDLLLGTLDVIFEHSEAAQDRRSMYGTAGRHRIKPYGVEYRTMSSTWLTSKQSARIALDAADLVHQVIEEGLDPRPLIKEIGIERLVTAINNCDAILCHKVWRYTLDYITSAGFSHAVEDAKPALHKLLKKGGYELEDHKLEVGW
ncbi:MAG: hypothetical protein GY809_20415, partial [Planctomycetes bacterium]|nr:hypothetical protein [Planctomycetota bacterium]